MNDGAGFTGHQVCEARSLNFIARTDEGVILFVCEPERKDTLFLFIGLRDMRGVCKQDEPSNSFRGCERKTWRQPKRNLGEVSHVSLRR